MGAGLREMNGLGSGRFKSAGYGAILFSILTFAVPNTSSAQIMFNGQEYESMSEALTAVNGTIDPGWFTPERREALGDVLVEMAVTIGDNLIGGYIERLAPFGDLGERITDAILNDRVAWLLRTTFNYLRSRPDSRPMLEQLMEEAGVSYDNVNPEPYLYRGAEGYFEYERAFLLHIQRQLTLKAASEGRSTVPNAWLSGQIAALDFSLCEVRRLGRLDIPTVSEIESNQPCTLHESEAPLLRTSATLALIDCQRSTGLQALNVRIADFDGDGRLDDGGGYDTVPTTPTRIPCSSSTDLKLHEYQALDDPLFWDEFRRVFERLADEQFDESTFRISILQAGLTIRNFRSLEQFSEDWEFQETVEGISRLTEEPILTSADVAFHRLALSLSRYLADDLAYEAARLELISVPRGNWYSFFQREVGANLEVSGDAAAILIAAMTYEALTAALLEWRATGAAGAEVNLMEGESLSPRLPDPNEYNSDQCQTTQHVIAGQVVMTTQFCAPWLR